MSFKSIELLAESRILKHEGEYLLLHKGDVLKCLKIWEFLSLSVCSFILVETIKLVFTSFKIKNMFSVRDRTPVALKSMVVYQFSCAGCNSRYIGETSRHFSTNNLTTIAALQHFSHVLVYTLMFGVTL